MKMLAALILTIGFMVPLFSAKAIKPLDDPEEWRNSILWNEMKPVSFYAKYDNSDELAGGLTLGYSDNLMPTAAAAVSNHLSDIINGKFWDNLKYSAQLNHGFLQAVVTGNRSDIKYLLVPKALRSDQQTGSEEVSIGAIVQGSKSQLTRVGATANIYGVGVDSISNDDWTNANEISIQF